MIETEGDGTFSPSYVSSNDDRLARSLHKLCMGRFRNPTSTKVVLEANVHEGQRAGAAEYVAPANCGVANGNVQRRPTDWRSARQNVIALGFRSSGGSVIALTGSPVRRVTSMLVTVSFT